MHALAALLAASGMAPAPPDLAGLAWMAGHWRGSEGGTSTEELWLAPAGGLMPGLNRSVGPNGTRFEFLRIALEDDQVVYLASPEGRPPTRFVLESRGERSVRFANPAHDYPRFVSYRAMGGQRLRACVGDDEARESCWEWQRVADGVAP